MGQRKLLANKLKKDADNALRFIKNIDKSNVEYYLSSKYFKRKLASLKRDYIKNLDYYFSPRYLKRKISSLTKGKKNVSGKKLETYLSSTYIKRKLISLKKEYFKNMLLLKKISLKDVDLKYYFSAKSTRRRIEVFKKEHQRFYKVSKQLGRQTAIAGTIWAGWNIVPFVFPNQINTEINEQTMNDFYAQHQEKEQKFTERLEEKEKQQKRKKIEEYKKTYQKDSVSVAKNDITDNDYLQFLENKLPMIFAKSGEHREKNIDDIISKRYQQIKDITPEENVSLKDLLSLGGISIEALQTAISLNPDMILTFKSGQTNKKLAKSADKVTRSFRPQGRCLEGVQKILEEAGSPNLISRGSPNWPQRLKGCKDNSACNAYIPLEKNGKYIILTVKNSAYQKSITSVENREMRNFAKQLIPGTIVITDNVIADEYKTRSYKELRKIYGRGGKLHGHIAVIDNSHYFKSDGCEPNGPDFSRYGEYIRIPLPRDIKIPKTEILEILRIDESKKQERAEVSHKNVTNWGAIFMQNMERS